MRKNTLQFRPTVESLEGRRLMAADIGIDAIAPTPQEPVSPGNGGGLHAKVLVYGATASGQQGSGGGILNDYGGTLSARAGGGIENNMAATDAYFADAGVNGFPVVGDWDGDGKDEVGDRLAIVGDWGS